MGGGRKESHRDSSLSARRRQKDGTREGNKRRKRREQRTISQRQGKRMSNAGGTPPPTTPLYRPQAGSPAPAIQRSSPENSPAAQRSSPKKSQGIQRKLIRHKWPHRRTMARFAAQRLLSTRPVAAPERARGEVAGPRSKTPMRVASALTDAFGQGILSSRHAQANRGLKRGELL